MPSIPCARVELDTHGGRHWLPGKPNTALVSKRDGEDLATLMEANREQFIALIVWYDDVVVLRQTDVDGAVARDDLAVEGVVRLENVLLAVDGC